MIEPMDMLPEEEEAAEKARLDALAARVEAFGCSLAKKRQEAIDGRKASGIEEEWVAAEEAYQGIDDANRADVAMGKPSSPNGGYVNTAVQDKTRSRVFLNITRPYTDAAAARVGDMLLPTDDTPWAIKQTPLPQLEAMQRMLPGVVPQGQAAGMTGVPMNPAGAAQQAGEPLSPQPPQVSAVQQAIDKIKREAQEKADGATKQIEDWLIECQWHGEVRKMIEDSARLGTGVLKGPFPAKRISRKTVSQEGLIALMVEQTIAPHAKAISPWNFYPDPACGENHHEGSYVWERDSLTGRALKDLKGLPGYIESQIEKVLEEGPSGKHKTGAYMPGSVKSKDDDQFDVWYFYGLADRVDLEAAGVDLPDEGDVSCFAQITMVNDCVIKAALNPLDSGDFPYDVMPWQRKNGVPWGTGVSMQVNTPQRMLNAATRNMMDNAGYSAGPQLVLRRDAITPADGTWTITPRKIWYVNDGADAAAVQQAFMAINIPTMQQELMGIVQFALKMAEDVTGLPMLMQGQGGQAPDTVGGMQLLHNNASVVLRRIARLFDDRVTRPHIRRFYEWLMTYGEDDSIKGDFQIEVRGSTALVERDIQTQAILQMSQLTMNPAFGLSPERWAEEYLKSLKLDPKRLKLTDDEKAQAAQQQPPQAPQIEVAQIREQGAKERLEMKLQADMQSDAQDAELAKFKIQQDTDRDTAYVNAQSNRDQVMAQAKFAELQLKRELAMLEYANTNKVSLEKIKADLAKEAMKINSVKELAGMKATADQLPKPPIEPAGRAQPGMSFQQ